MRRMTGLLLGVMAAACGGDGPTTSDGIASVQMNANAITLFAGQTEQLAAAADSHTGAFLRKALKAAR